MSSSNKGADFFLVKFWTQMLQNPECKHICEWAPDGRHLIIYDPDHLMAEIKTRGVCKQKDYDSFARQLRIYRWGRVKAEDCGVSPLPPEVKVWRHPRLYRDSPLVEVANVTRNAPPKPNKAALAAGLHEVKEPKSRKKATEIYEGPKGEDEDSDSDDDNRDDSATPGPPPFAVQVLPAPVNPNGDIPVFPPGERLQMPTTARRPIAPGKSTSTAERSHQGGANQRRPLSTVPSKANKLLTKKKQISGMPPSFKPAFDVETSIFDPNNTFGVTSARALDSYRGGSLARSYDDDDASSDSSVSSDDEVNALINSSASQSSYNPVLPSLSIPQVTQAFLNRVVYDNAAIEHAAHNPANYDRLPWSAPPPKPGQRNISGNPKDQQANSGHSLATLESRLQTISASLRAADAAAAQHVV